MIALQKERTEDLALLKQQLQKSLQQYDAALDSVQSEDKGKARSAP
ncbi:MULTISPECIES: hypothetical protein [Legionella]|uniref:Coiled-coil protein n=1 Tax=Legionella resiliens TaxID=2905958 RepID=A0ABS8X288_9GAMM|nr:MULTISPECIES: hypothetical protein [unclassified Legionella]MCE0721890.1 hypothetical protein [Legionella sp. 9fVS26]MCE3531044.1 hypothetical protein [Legionella sp. 8cVS16]QLZ70611.1 hypothetical protein FOLKNPGA_03425 [Legionella sp. PC1000]